MEVTSDKVILDIVGHTLSEVPGSGDLGGWSPPGDPKQSPSRDLYRARKGAGSPGYQVDLGYVPRSVGIRFDQ